MEDQAVREGGSRQEYGGIESREPNLQLLTLIIPRCGIKVLTGRTFPLPI